MPLTLKRGMSIFTSGSVPEREIGGPTPSYVRPFFWGIYPGNQSVW